MSSFSYVPTKTLNQLLCYAMEHECMFCDKTPEEAKKCAIRKMMDSALVHLVDAQDTAHCKYSDLSIGTEVTA